MFNNISIVINMKILILVVSFHCDMEEGLEKNQWEEVRKDCWEMTVVVLEKRAEGLTMDRDLGPWPRARQKHLDGVAPGL